MKELTKQMYWWDRFHINHFERVLEAKERLKLELIVIESKSNDSKHNS